MPSRTQHTRRHLIAASLAIVVAAGCDDDDDSGDGDGSLSPPIIPSVESNPEEEIRALPGGVAACGSLAVSSISPRGSENAPAFFTVGSVVSGTVDPDSASQRTHYWSILLQTGRYHLVLDSRRPDGTNGRIGLTLHDRLASDERWLQIQSTDEIDRRVREHGVLTVTGPAGSAAIVMLAVAAKYGPETYELAVLDDETTVPSPYFVDCPRVAPLALDTTEAFVLGASGSGTDERWFSIDHLPGDYLLSFDASSGGGGASDIDVEVDFLGRYGDNGPRAGDELTLEAIASTLSERIPLTVNGNAGAGRRTAAYMRLRNLGGELNASVALNRLSTAPLPAAPLPAAPLPAAP